MSTPAEACSGCCEPGCSRDERPYCHCQACGETGVRLSGDGYCAACESIGETTAQEDAPALCPCGERPATGAGFCDECRADAGEP